jgi:hypothetical protein
VRRGRVLVVSLCAVLVLIGNHLMLHAQAQAPARDLAPSIAPPVGTGSMSGTVKDHEGKPVRRSIVTITGDMRLTRMTVTDGEGRFAFAELPTGRFTVSAAKEGYPPMSYGAKRAYRAGAGVFLQAGERVEGLALTLPRGAVMAGTVYDEAGAPMPGVPVMAWEVRTSLGGERTLGYVGDTVTVITDDRGAYRLFGLPAGDFTVGTTWYYSGQPYEVRLPTAAEFKAAFQPAAMPTSGAPTRPPAQPAPEPARYNYAPVFTPGAADPMAATTFSLAPGEVREGIDLRMLFQPMSRIEGTVVNPWGSAASYGLSITRRSPVQALNIGLVTGTKTDGTFVSGSLSPGPYSVVVETRRSADSPPLWAMADVILGSGEPSVVTLTLQPAVTVTGRLEFHEGALPPPADLSKVVVSLIAMGPIRPEIETKVDATGAVSITGIIPGSYMIRASVPGPAPVGTNPAWSVRAVKVGTTDVTDRAFDVTAAGLSNLAIGFTDQVSELSGLLTTPTGEPETDYFIVALPADRAYWTQLTRRVVSTRPDGSGRYSFRGLPAGDYRLAVTTDLVPLDLREVSTLEPLAAQSVPVSLSTGQKVTMNLRTPPKTQFR